MFIEQTLEPNLERIEKIIADALAEDIGSGDETAALIPQDANAKLVFVTREKLIMAGGFIVPLVFASLDKNISTKVLVKEGEKAEQGSALIEVNGNARAILTGERVALNLLQRACSVATNTSKYVEKIKGTNAKILDTRKTMPCLRTIDKYAVRIGGGYNHRMGLYDAILIKDNHIAIYGSIKKVLETANKSNLPVEIECDNLAQMEAAIAVGAKFIMLDNMDNASLREAVKINNGRAKLEASGNVNLETIRAIAETGVDFISIGRLTHSVVNVDIGLDVKLESS